MRDNILTGEVRRSGIGGIDPARLERAMDQLRRRFPNSRSGRRWRISSTISFLPPLGGRLINERKTGGLCHLARDP